MEIIKQIIKVPKNHELRIKVPEHIPADEEAEIVLSFKKKSKSPFKAKIEELIKCKNDELFLEDMKIILDDFKAVDLEGL